LEWIPKKAIGVKPYSAHPAMTVVPPAPTCQDHKRKESYASPSSNYHAISAQQGNEQSAMVKDIISMYKERQSVS